MNLLKKNTDLRQIGMAVNEALQAATSIEITAARSVRGQVPGRPPGTNLTSHFGHWIWRETTWPTNLSLGARSMLRTRAKLTVMRVCSDIDRYIRCLEEWQQVRCLMLLLPTHLSLFHRRLLNEPRTMTDALRSSICSTTSVLEHWALVLGLFDRGIRRSSRVFFLTLGHLVGSGCRF